MNTDVELTVHVSIVGVSSFDWVEELLDALTAALGDEGQVDDAEEEGDEYVFYVDGPDTDRLVKAAHTALTASGAPNRGSAYGIAKIGGVEGERIRL